MQKKYFPLLILFLFLSFFKANASHLLGSDITYSCVGPNQYLVSLTVYRDCQGINAGNSQSVSYSSISCGVDASLSLNRVSNTDITPLCATETSACGGNGLYGVEENVYQGVLTLPSGCSDFIFSWQQCCRNNAINTLSGPGSQNMYVSSSLDNTVTPCNSSPVFNNTPASYICVNEPFTYNHGVSDVDGDSLVFSLGNCFQDNGSQVVYNAGFSGITPLSTLSGVTVNSSTGALTFTPTTPQVGVLCILVEEFRNGVKIGEVNRDMQFNVINCTNISPEATGIDSTDANVVSNFTTSICANAPICFTIDGSDPNNDNVIMSWNNEIPAGNFSVTNNGSTQPEAEFCWTPTSADIGQHVFTVNLEDDNCPIIGTSTYTYIIDVLPSPNTLSISPDISICPGGSTVLTASSTPAATSYTWSPSASLSSSTGSSVTATPSSSTAYTLEATYPDGCDLQESVLVLFNALPTATVTPATSSNCAGGTVTLTANSNSAGLTFQWFDPSMAPLGAGTVSGPSSTLNVTLPSNSGSYIYTVEITNPATGCMNSNTAVVNIAAPTGMACNIIYASTTGSNFAAGTQASPTSLAEAISRGACNGTVIKIATGTYNIGYPLTIPSYITLEGGFNEGAAWQKSSTTGATVINRTNANPEGPVNARRLVAFYGNGSSGFRFQDITITTANANLGGMSTYGLHLTNCSNYDIVRTQILPGNAGTGINGSTGAPGGDGSNGINGGNGHSDNQNTDGAGGRGGNGNAGVNGGNGAPSNGGCCNTGTNGTVGTSATNPRFGGGGGGGGRGGQEDRDGGNGGVGGGTTLLGNNTGGGGSGQESGCNSVAGSCNNALSGNDGSNGTNGSNGSTGALGSLGSIVGAFFNPGGQGSTGTAGFGGSGGRGGGGGAGEGGFLCTDGAGAGGGGGGGGGSGGFGGTGGYGGGSSYGLFLFNNGINGNAIQANLVAGAAGNGGLGGLGGNRGDGGSGGNGGTDIISDFEIGCGGDGGDGGSGGFGGRGGNGRPGNSIDVFLASGSALVSSDINFNLAAQPIIQAENINCTNIDIDYSSSIAATWGFGVGASPLTAGTTSITTTQYSSLGRKNIQNGAQTYIGFSNILLENNIVPTISTDAPLHNGVYTVCAGSFVSFSATNGGVGYSYEWSLGGGSVPNIYSGTTFENINSAGFYTPGIYTIQLRYITDCCGLSAPGTIELHVEEVPALVTSGDASLCEGASAVELNAFGLTTGGSVNWSSAAGLNRTDSTHVLALPSSTTTYTVIMTDSTGLCEESQMLNVSVFGLDLTANTSDQICVNDGSIVSIPVTGGSGLYSYSYNGSNVSLPMNNLLAGNYSIVVTDNITTCQDSIIATVNPAASAIVGWISNTQNVSCAGSLDGNLTVSVFGGTPPYTYIWASGSSTVSASNSNTSGMHGGGVDTVIITDNLGCFTVVGGYINEPDSLTLTVLNNVSASCPSANDGTLNVSVDNGISPFQYSWDTGNPADTFALLSNIGIGIYCLDVIDRSGCVSTICDTISSPDMVDIDTVINICQGDSQFLDGAWQNANGIFIDTVLAISTGGVILDTVVYETFNGVNTWTFTDGTGPTSNNDVNSNIWTIGAGENGVPPPACSPSPANLAGDQTMHITNNLFGVNTGALYIEAGLPGSIVFDSDKNATSANISTIGLTGIVLNFDFIGNGDALFDNASVHFSDDGGATWNVVDNSLKSPLCGVQGQWTFASYPLPVSAENIPNLQIRFNWVNDDDNVGTATDPSVAINNLFVTGNYTLSSLTCDTVRTTQLIVNPTYSNPPTNASICQNDSFLLPSGNFVNIEGTYIDTFYTISGCDSLFTTVLAVDSFIIEVIDTTLCVGEMLMVNGTSYSTNQTNILDTARYAVSNCDSILYDITIHIDTVATMVIDTTLCIGEMLMVNGTSYSTNQTNTLDTARYAVSNCDSILYDITIHIDTVAIMVIDTILCIGEMLMVNGTSYSTNQTNTLDTARYAVSNCDSILYDITIHIDTVATMLIDTTLCIGEMLMVNGTSYSTNQTNTLDTARYAVSNCDSILYDITIHIDTVATMVIDTTLCIGEMLMVNGTSYSTNQTNTLDTARYAVSNCDSVLYDITIHIDTVATMLIDTTLCIGEMLMVNGISYSTNQTNTLDTARYAVSNCDSILYDITIHIDTVAVIVIDTTLCVSELLMVNGISYSTNQTNTLDTARYGVSNCDSILYDITIHIDTVAIMVIDTTLCIGEMLMVNGTSYSTNQTNALDTARYTVSNCDSILYDITIHIDTVATMVIDTTLCIGEMLMVNGTSYSTNQTNILDTARYAVSNCDSILYDITIHIDTVAMIVIDTTLCVGEMLMVNGTSYSTNQTNTLDTARYAVSNCDSILYDITIHIDTVATMVIDTTLCIGEMLMVNGTSYSTNQTNTLDTARYAVSNCDSILYDITIHIDTVATMVIDTTLCIGEMLMVNGTSYSTNQTNTLDTARYAVSNCDSVLYDITIHIDTVATMLINTTLCIGEMLMVNGTSYSTSQTNTLDTARYAVSNCDSVLYDITIHIDTVATMLIDTTLCIGEMLMVNGISYSTNQTNTLDTARYAVSNCDSILYDITIHIDTVAMIVIDTTLCVGEMLMVNGTSYSTNQTNTLDTARYAVSNCDSILYDITIHIDTVATMVIDTTLCIGEMLMVNGTSYSTNQTNALDTARYTVSNCDSILYDITIHIDTVATTVIDTTLCIGEMLMVNGTSYSTNQTNTLDTARYAVSNCDSILYDITIHIDTVTTTVIDTTLCVGEMLMVNGTNYSTNQTNTLDTARYAVSNCDSILYDITIHIDTVATMVIDTTLCIGEMLMVNGTSYSTNQTNTLDTARYAESNCDSILYDITIHIDTLVIMNIDTSICQGMNILVNGQPYNSSGIFFDTLRFNQSSCDSVQFVITLQVDSVYNDTISPSVCANETYTLPDASVVNTAGIYSFIDTTINGCDSLYTVVLTIDTLPVSHRNDEICFGDSIFLANAWQNTTGVYADTFAVAGPSCDSIRLTTLTINALPVVVASANDSTLCQNETLILSGSGADSYVWTNSVNDNVGFVQPVGNVSYVVTGTDTNSCVDTASISILVSPIYNWSESIPICEDALPYTYHDGSVHNTSTNDSHVSVLTTINGCDSIITTNLVVNRLGVFGTIPDTIKQCDNFYIEIEMSAQNITSYQWQMNDGSGFTNIVSGGIYNGMDTNKLIISPLNVSLNGNSYRVVMFDECGNGPLMDTTSLRVTEPHDLINPIDDIVRCLRDSSLIYVDYNGYNYVWNNGQTGPYLRVYGDGLYSVTFTENGTDCEMEDDFEVVINDCVENCVVLAPTGFSPNESNTNDVFNVMTSCEEGFSYYEFRIFNRWGEMVYFSSNPNDGWDGNYKGSKAEIGVYAYSLDYTKNGKNIKEKLAGQVSLIR